MNNKRRNRNLIFIIIGGVSVFLSVFGIYKLQFNNVEFAETVIEDTQPVQQEVQEKYTFEYGFNSKDFKFIKKKVSKGESLGKILDQNGVSPLKVHELVESSKDVFNPRYIKVGAPYTLVEAKDSTSALAYMVYEKSLIEYVIFAVGDSVFTELKEREVSRKQAVSEGVITSSLSQTIDELGLGQPLAHRIEDVYAWSINFFTLRPQDKFKVVYTIEYIDDTIKVPGSENILAATFTHQGREFNAYSFLTPEGWTEYYDEEGKSLRKSFLMAPLKTYRISSRFTKKRFHPVQKRWKAHKGTDFAAPRGTPIMTTATGTVIKKGYTSGNGNYVKVKHNSKYTTQYLHMSKFAKGIGVGSRVKQGDVIGYVGSTGLATGPHVCYRFWVNGVQRDPYKQDLPEAEPIKEEWKASFFETLNKWDRLLNNAPEA